MNELPRYAMWWLVGATLIASGMLGASKAWGDEPSPYVPQYPPNAPIVQRPYLPGGEWKPAPTVPIKPRADGQPNRAIPVGPPVWTLTPGYMLDDEEP